MDERTPDPRLQFIELDEQGRTRLIGLTWDESQHLADIKALQDLGKLLNGRRAELEDRMFAAHAARRREVN